MTELQLTCPSCGHGFVSIGGTTGDPTNCPACHHILETQDTESRLEGAAVLKLVRHPDLPRSESYEQLAHHGVTVNSPMETVHELWCDEQEEAAKHVLRIVHSRLTVDLFHLPLWEQE